LLHVCQFSKLSLGKAALFSKNLYLCGKKHVAVLFHVGVSIVLINKLVGEAFS